MNAENKVRLVKNSACNSVIQIFKWCLSDFFIYHAVMAFDNYCSLYLEHIVILHFKGKLAAMSRKTDSGHCPRV